MAADMTRRDYGLTGRDGALAQEKGLANAQWYVCPLPRERLKALMRRKDGPAIRDTLIWSAALIATGGLGWTFWGDWWAVPFFAVYGVLYGSAADSRWHECSHGTAFRTRWLNDAVYGIASFMMLREPTVWRWSHARHHTDTLIVGRDPEILASRPPDFTALLLNLFALKSGVLTLDRLARHATGRLTADEATFIPPTEHRKVFWTARAWIVGLAGIAIWCVAIGSILPAMLIGLPSFYGTWLHLVLALTQHAGLAEDVLDHRLNSRTVYMNPVLRFLYWNMNYHIEHHIFPMVPYHALPALHRELKADMPPAYNGLLETYREIAPALLRQAKDPEYHVQRPLPPFARPSAAPLAAATGAA
jgi:fatty acid desaturase